MGALAKLILYAQGELGNKEQDLRSPPRKKPKMSKSEKNQSQTKSFPLEYELADIRRHPVLKPFHPWLKYNPKEWDPMSTPHVFKKVFAQTSSHAAALLASNPGANLAPLLTIAYLQRLTRLAEAVFRKGNGGLVIVALDTDIFDSICEKHIPALAEENELDMQVENKDEKISLNELRRKLKADWDKAAVAELKKRPADDPLVNMMKHWSSPFLKHHKLLQKFS